MSQGVTPLVINLGRASRKRVRALEEGRGELVEDLSEVMERVRAELGGDAEQYTLVPVVIVYKRKKDKAHKSRRGLMDLLLG
jgi:hypothetical protein